MSTSELEDEAKRQREWLRVHLEVTRALAESTGVVDAAPRILVAICDGLRWDVGALWLIDSDAEVLRCLEVRHADGALAPDFELRTKEATFARGIGLPGRVWRLAAPIWVDDVRHAYWFLRAPVATREGLRTGMGCPLLVGTAVVGVIEVFSNAERENHPDLVELMMTIGAQIGQFVERKHAEDVVLRQNGELLAADRRKNQFLAMLAHELRNPLAPVASAVQILKSTDAPPEAREASRAIIERQLVHLSRLVDDLLDVSRITSGKIILHKDVTALAPIVARSIDAARPLVQGQGHALEISLPETPLLLDADPVRIEQVVTNLLANAAKYTERGGRILLAVLEEEGHAVIRVRDTGVGIPREMIDRVFDMFLQLDTSLERAQGGLGIGLTLVKTLVEMHGGSVTATSDGPGTGSEFVVRLPLLPQAAARPELPLESAAPGRPCRVLVVDDNHDAADSLHMLLDLAGHDVRIAYDGPGAVAVTSEFHPEVVFLDIGLPGLNGYEVAPRLRQSESGVVLVAVTGWGQEDDRRRTREAGFDHHLVKPVLADDIYRLLTAIKP